MMMAPRATSLPVPLVVGNDGNYGGVAEARLARGKTKASVLMLMPRRETSITSSVRSMR